MNWADFIQEEQQKDYFKNIVKFVMEETNRRKTDVHPRRENLYLAYKLCPIEKIKVVIIGQDPYHGAGQAHGLSFSVPKGVAIPASLRNIYKEIKADIGDVELNHGCLTSWADQGVFLLNSMLTVAHGEAGSHRKAGWETFTDATIKIINDLDRPVVFILWGAFAKGKRHIITNEKHLILEAAHPSPFSAYDGFFGCKHFSKANEFLVRHDIGPIDWSVK